MALTAAVLEVLVRANTTQASAALARTQAQLKATGAAAQSSATRMTDAYNRAGTRTSAVGRKLTTHLALPAAAVGAASVKMAMDFEESMLKVQTLAGVSEDRMKSFHDEVLKLAPAVGKAPQELAEALYFISSSGIKASDAMEVLTITAKASAVGLGETEVVADAVTSAMNAYRRSNLDAKDATEVLMKTVKEGKGEPEELAASIGRVIPVASKLKVPFNDVGASLAGLTLQGLDAAEATTALRGVFMALLKPTKDGEDALGKVGLSAQTLRDILEKKGTLAMLTRLSTEFKGNEEAMAKVFPNVRALVGAFNLTGDSAKKNADIFAAMNKETDFLGKQFKATSESDAFKFQQGLAELRVAAIKLGMALLPTVIKLTKAIAGLASAFAKMPGFAKDLLIGAIVLGPLISMVGWVLKLAAAWKAVRAGAAGAGAAQAGATAAGGTAGAGGRAAAAGAAGAGAAGGAKGAKTAGAGWGKAFGVAAIAAMAIPLREEGQKMTEQSLGDLGQDITKWQDKIAALPGIGGIFDPIGSAQKNLEGLRDLMQSSASKAAEELSGLLEEISRTKIITPEQRAQLTDLMEKAELSKGKMEEVRASIAKVDAIQFKRVQTQFAGLRKDMTSGNDVIRQSAISTSQTLLNRLGGSFQSLQLKSKTLKSMLTSNFADVRKAGEHETKKMANKMGIHWKALASMLKGQSDNIRLIVFQALSALGVDPAAIRVEIARRSTGSYSKGDTKGAGLQRGGLAASLVPGFGTGDKVHAMLEPGEVVVNRKAVAAMGGADRVNSINRAIPRFAAGGPVTGSVMGGAGGAGMTARAASASLVAGGNEAFRRLKKLVGAEGNWKSVDALARKLGLTIASGFRAGDDGFHGSRQAKDYSDGYATPAEFKFGTQLANSIGPKLLELIHTPLGYSYDNFKKTAPFAQADHYDHVHVALSQKYQKGGIPRRLNRRYPINGSATIEPWEAAALAEMAGLPGRTMAAVARGESSYRPGARSGDGGMGLWQMTPSVQSAATRNKWESMGSYFNPWHNAQMAAWFVNKAGAPLNEGTWHAGASGVGWNAHYSGKMWNPNAKAGGGKKSSKTKAAPTFDAKLIDKLPLKDAQKATLKTAIKKMANLPGKATNAGDLADRASELEGLVGGRDEVSYLREQLDFLWAYRNWLVAIHNLVTKAVESMNEQIAKMKSGPGKAKKKQIRDVANTKLAEVATALTEVQGTVVGADPFKHMKTLPGAPGMFGGSIFEVQMRLKDIGAEAGATEETTNLTASQLKELGYLSTLGVKFNPSQFAGFFAGGGVLGAGQWGIAGERGPEAVVGPAAISPGGAINVRVFIGDRELTDIVRVETDERDRSKRGAYMAGRGAR